MGAGNATNDDLSNRQAYRQTTGTTFKYTSDMHNTPINQQKVHPSVDPMLKNTRGVQIRECLDSVDHPNTKGAVIGFDQTGSMDEIPRMLQKNLATLKGATLRMGLNDLQLCFCAYGDAKNHEVAPCQVGQFESGLIMEDWLNNLYLEGQGGGNGGETAGLLIYFLAVFAQMDCVNKRGEKGYLILTGDECPHTEISKWEVEKYLGLTIENDISIEQVIKMAKEKFEIFFFHVDNYTARHQESLRVWQELLGKNNVISSENLDTISEQIALLIAYEEGIIETIDSGGSILLAEGADKKNVQQASLALAQRGPRTNKMAKATVTGSLKTMKTSNPIRRL